MKGECLRDDQHQRNDRQVQEIFKAVGNNKMGEKNNQESNNGVGSVEGVDRGAIRN